MTDPEQAVRLIRQRIAKAKLAVGVPSFLVCLFVVVAAYRFSGRPLLALDLWFLLAGILVVFGGYLGHTLWQLRKAGKQAPESH